MELDFKVEIPDANDKARIVIEYKDTDAGIESASISVMHQDKLNQWTGHTMALDKKTLNELREALWGLEFMRPSEENQKV